MSPRNAALAAGCGYLLVFLLATFANSFSFGKLVVHGDATMTAKNILAHMTLYRVGLATWIAVIVCDAIVAWALYFLFKPVHNGLALLAAWARLVFVAVFAYSFVGCFSVTRLFSGADYLAAFTKEQLQAQAMLLLDAQAFGQHVSYVFFGLHVFLIGYLILKYGQMPRWLGVMLLVAGCGYWIDSFGNFLSAGYAESKTAFLIFVAGPAVVAEFSLTLWLLFKGGKSAREGLS
jgi:hypothetical protein